MGDPRRLGEEREDLAFRRDRPGPEARPLRAGRGQRAWPLDAAPRPRPRRGSPGQTRSAPHPGADPDGENHVSQPPGFLRIPDAAAATAQISAHGGAPAATHSRLRSER